MAAFFYIGMAIVGWLMISWVDRIEEPYDSRRSSKRDRAR